MLHLSQGQLTLLSTCPRKFQYLYLEQLGSLIPADQQERFAWGNRFHLLMQQRELGLPIGLPMAEAVSPEDRQLQTCVDAFVQAAPDLFQSRSYFRQSEHRRTCALGNYLLTVVYDLLILEEQRAQILDWKTYPRPQTSRWLAEHWQTRLYPFVLAETSDCRPEQISMTYWFVQASPAQPPAPEKLEFAYSRDRHQQTHQTLLTLLDQLTAWLQQHQAGVNLPQAAAAAGHCNSCAFALRCQRTPLDPAAPPQKFTSVHEIEEVSL